jgi:hypothetical protein
MLLCKSTKQQGGSCCSVIGHITTLAHLTSGAKWKQDFKNFCKNAKTVSVQAYSQQWFVVWLLIDERSAVDWFPCSATYMYKKISYASHTEIKTPKIIPCTNTHLQVGFTVDLAQLIVGWEFSRLSNYRWFGSWSG